MEATEEFLNLAYHPAIGITPYSAMYERQPPREIEEILEFPRAVSYTHLDVYKRQSLDDAERRSNQERPEDHRTDRQVTTLSIPNEASNNMAQRNNDAEPLNGHRQ